MCSIQYEYGYKMNTIQPQKGRKFWHNLDEPRILSEIHCGGCSVAKSCPTLTTAWTAAFQASCPWLSPRVCSNSCPLNRWCHPIVSSSVTLFSFCLPSLSQIQKPTYLWFHLYEISRIVKPRKHILVVSREGEYGLRGFFGGWWKCSGIRSWWCLHNFVNIQKPLNFKFHGTFVTFFKESATGRQQLSSARGDVARW